MSDFPPYPSGLRLAGRRVLVVGGGHVAQRRVPQVIAVGADVHVVSPVVTPAIEGLVGSGEITWHERPFEDGDLDGSSVRRRGDRRPRRQRPRVPGCARPSGSSACARTTPPSAPRGRPRSAARPGSPSPWSATATRAARRPCATRSSPACATAPSPHRTTASAPPG
ncbi:NAD(P)-dependent oxidoreductase [Nocardioides convexus]|uniref:precorrin-2 dehydrogenase/sirohydrochlorin ferrochelatase family protein n=1 Tax=Nocardioides convexus TaxID=2712224 RepID=UPI002418507B|nr:NAD(P)-dependent oxidoreductase [Nocardioides convexus]